MHKTKAGYYAVGDEKKMETNGIKQNDFTAPKTTLIELLLVVSLVIVVSWIWNAAKLTACDFESDYRCEVIHGVGLIVPPLSVVTVWFADDNA